MAGPQQTWVDDPDFIWVDPARAPPAFIFKPHGFILLGPLFFQSIPVDHEAILYPIRLSFSCFCLKQSELYNVHCFISFSYYLLSAFFSVFLLLMNVRLRICLPIIFTCGFILPSKGVTKLPQATASHTRQ